MRGAAHGPVGWVEDLAELDAALKAPRASSTTGCSTRPGLESPTLERLCLYFAERLKPRFPGLKRIVVSRPTVGERCGLSL